MGQNAEVHARPKRKRKDMRILTAARNALYVAKGALEAVQREQALEGKCLFCVPATEAPERLVAGHIQDCPAPLVTQALQVLAQDSVRTLLRAGDMVQEKPA